MDQNLKRYLGVFFLGVIMSPLISYAQDDRLFVPVVVHVLYENEAERLSESQIYSQIEALNQDFNLETDTSAVVEVFKEVVANSHITFFVTAFDEDSLSTTGITYTETDVLKFSGTAVFDESKGGKSPWDTERFLNIWVCDLTDGIVGLEANHQLGVVVDYKAFGTEGDLLSNYALGHTLTHEVGHFLGLKHTWSIGQDSCSNPDGIDDTPNQATVTNCNLSQYTCGSLDMVQNFMNSAPDLCLLFFTEGQTQQMRSVLLDQKVSLLTDTIFGRVSYEQEEDTSSMLTEKYTIYPNPNSLQEFSLSYVLSPPDKIELISAVGEKINELSWSLFEENSIKISLNDVENGLYYLFLQRGDRTFTSKILINN